jgi:hypothetical protein
MTKATAKATWAFVPRFRRGAFGWRSEPAIARIKEASSEIKAVSKKDALLAAEGAVLFLQKVSPAVQNVDGSSGAMGTTVNRAIDALVPVIANAPAAPALRRKWLEQLFQAHADDEVPYIEYLADVWGDLCASPEIAAEWADRLTGTVDTMWSRGRQEHGFFHGTTMCLSALLAAGRHDQLLALLEKAPYTFWSYRQWGVKALVAQGKNADALQYAESSRGLNAPLGQIAEVCEAILLSSGLADEAYRRYAIDANQAGTYLATFRTICRKYPHMKVDAVLADLVASTPGEEGKWFAAAKDAKLYDVALKLAQKSPVDHRTLIRAADDFAGPEPVFALNCGLLALYWICAGRAYDVTNSDILTAYELTIQAAERAQCKAMALAQVRKMLDGFPQARMVKGALARVTELWAADPGACAPIPAGDVPK